MSAGFQAVNIPSRLDSRDMSFPLLEMETTAQVDLLWICRGVYTYYKKRCGATFTFLLQASFISIERSF
jgi:hypothetical protein